jgi:hypothetical protein
MLTKGFPAVKKKMEQLGHPVTSTDFAPVIRFSFLLNSANYTDGKHS